MREDEATKGESYAPHGRNHALKIDDDYVSRLKALPQRDR
jgi:hypothetical protein